MAIGPTRYVATQRHRLSLSCPVRAVWTRLSEQRRKSSWDLSGVRLAFNTVVRAERSASGDPPPTATPRRQMCAETMANLIVLTADLSFRVRVGLCFFVTG